MMNVIYDNILFKTLLRLPFSYSGGHSTTSILIIMTVLFFLVVGSHLT
jgi:hypothetical protein